MMRNQMAAMMTGVVLVMSAATLPASAKVSHTITQPLLEGEPQTQVLSKTGDREQQKSLFQKWILDEKGVEGNQLAPSRQTDTIDRLLYAAWKNRTKR